MSKYYAVKKGKEIGVFLTWEECEEQVKGFKGAVYKAFPTKEMALEFITENKTENTLEGLIAYVDGSYNIKSKTYGYGCVLIEGQQVIQQLYGNGAEEKLASMRNVAGEIIGSEVAIRYAIDHAYKSICVYYDYEGIKKWANKTWKANKIGTIAYQKFIEESRQKIQISFVKVLAHSGDIYNDIADKLAKTAVGIKWKE